MRFPLPILAAGLGLLAASPGLAATFTTSRTYDASSIQTVAITFPCGDLRVEAIDGDEVTVFMQAECRKSGGRCEARVHDLRLVSKSNDRTLELTLEGMRKTSLAGSPNVELRVGVPRAAALRIEMGAGDLVVDQVIGDVKVAMGAGDVHLMVPERSVAAVAVNVGVGDATLRRPRGPLDARGFISKRLRWSGEGESHVDVDLGVGDVRVALE